MPVVGKCMRSLNGKGTSFNLNDKGGNPDNDKLQLACWLAILNQIFHHANDMDIF